MQQRVEQGGRVAGWQGDEGVWGDCEMWYVPCYGMAESQYFVLCFSLTYLTPRSPMLGAGKRSIDQTTKQLICSETQVNRVFTRTQLISRT